MNPKLDLEIERVIRAPRQAVWDAWTDPRKFEQWFLPRPSVLRVERFEPHPTGALVTSMAQHPNGDFTRHVDGCFLAVDELERIVFTTAIESDWRPREHASLRMTATITLDEHPDGTSYRAVVAHADTTDRDQHDALGFADGWGTCISQLADLIEFAQGSVS